MAQDLSNLGGHRHPWDAISQLYREVEASTRPLDDHHRSRLKCCKGCAGCCVDAITVFEVEAQNILKHHATWMRTAAPYPEGACAFLDGEGACRIYADRPYVCRTQGYPLRWLDVGEDGAPIEFRDICPLNDSVEAEPLETLATDQCWTLGEVEERLAWLQFQHDGAIALGQAQGLILPNPSRRVSLRALFRLAQIGPSSVPPSELPPLASERDPQS